MDQTSFNLQSGEPQGVVLKKDNGKKGLFEIVLIIILLILNLGMLNYLNILPLSSTFPNYLGFLPHKTSQQTQQPNIITTTPTAIPTPLPSALSEVEKQTLINYIQTFLNPSLLA